MAGSLDHRQLVDLLEEFLLGEQPSLTGNQLADEVGIPFEEAQLRWRSLGFSDVGADVPAFTHADLEALRLTQRLLDIGLISPEDESALVRTLGRSFARLAEWQMGLLAKVVDPDRMSVDELRSITDEVIPAVESLQNYVWRRHTLSAASRLLLADTREREDTDERGPEEDVDDAVLGVGFADIVNYTKQSRSLTRGEISRLIDHFEERALARGTHRRRGVPGAPGGPRLGAGPGPSRRRSRPSRQRGVPTDVQRPSGHGAGRSHPGRRARAGRGPVAAPAAAYVGAGLQQARTMGLASGRR